MDPRRDRNESEVQDDYTEATNIDDDEVEELHNSLKEVVQDPAVKPKFQCLMVDPSFSMVTVQSEDSGIVWETASSRCSTPWASEASSPSDTYSLEGSGTQGNIVIIMDEDKVKRRRKTSRGKLCDRFRRPGSRFSGSAIGEERPAMIEVSVPNIRSENSEDDQSAESKLDKAQELFNLVSEGFEILNIVVPSKLPTVDEESSTELSDNLAYLEDTPKIKSKCKQEGISTTITSPEEISIEIKDARQEGISQTTVEEQPKKDETDVDYLEKFTLLDQHTPADESEKLKVTELIRQDGPQVLVKEQKADDTADEDSFVIISEVEIANDHLDEVFYGTKCNAEPKPSTHPKDDEENTAIKSLKECGSTLFGSQETILTPIFLPDGPPKIIDQDLLDEPRALSFHYSDLYEDAVGDQKKDDDFSDRESIASEKSFKRRYSDSDDGDGYLEKFILKDDAPVVEVVPVVDTIESSRVIWPQSKFEMTGCLIRVKEENEPQEEEVGDSQSNSGSKCNTEPQIQPPDTSGGHGDCDEPKPGCLTVTSVSKVLEDCRSTTGSAIAKPVSRDKLSQKVDGTEKQQTDKVILIDGKQSDVPVEEKPGDLPIPQEHDLEKLTSAVKNKLSFKNGLEEVHRVTDSTDEIQEPIVGTNKEVSDKRQKDTPAMTATAQPQEDVNLKELHVDKNEFTSKPDVPHKHSEETKLSGEGTVVHESEHHEITAALLECKPEVPESKEILALSEDTVAMSLLPESEKQEQVTDTPVTLEVKYNVSTERKAKDTEDKTKLEGICEHKAMEEPQVSKMDAAVKVETTEKITIESEDLRVESEDMPVDSVTTEKNEMVGSSAVEIVNDEVPFVLRPKKANLADGVGKVTKDSVVEGEKTGRDKMLANKDEQTEAGRDVTSVDSLQRLCHPVPEIKVRDLVQEVVNEGEGRKEKEVVRNEEDYGNNREHPVIAFLFPESETEGSSKSLPEVVIQEVNVAVDSNLTNTTSKTPEPINLVSKVDNSCKMALLKDTHKEKICRTLEYPPLSSPVDSPTVRVSPVDFTESSWVDDFEVKMTRDKGPFSTLRSFTPQEDLSRFGRELDLQKQTSEELSYEIVTEQDARQAEAEGTVCKEDFKEHGRDQSPQHSTEADYEFIEDVDASQLSELEQFQEEGDTEPVDAFCLVCQCPVLMSDDGHQNHEMTTPEKAFEDMKSQLNKWISVLQERAENMEDLVSELELAYNSVEEQCKDCEKALDEQNEEMLKIVMDRYNEMSQNMEEEKKAKLEKLYDQIVSFQENVDSAKETVEKTTMMMEETDELTFVSSYEEVETRLKTALESTMSLELGPRGLLVFEDYTKGATGNEKKNSQNIPVPQQPHLQPQGSGSATTCSVTVYWTVNEGDIIDCFQVYCMEEPQGAIAEEYRVTVKESYCNLEELEPDTCYKVWVMSVNYTGCSLPSEKLCFRTAPSVPVINSEACTVLWDAAIIRWSLAQPTTAESFTLEYCRQYALEGEGLRSVSGIKGNEHKVLLTPNENFLFYIKSVNTAGASEQSEAALISTRGTRFHLRSETANRALKVSEDKNSVQYAVESYDMISGHTESPAVMGELLPRVGYHYWETLVAGCKAYRIGIAYRSVAQNSTVGDNSSSWCLHCVPTSISCRFELLHDSVESDIFVTVVPTRIGTLLDFTQGRLVFFNAQNGQCLGSFQHAFSQACYAVFALEKPGNLELKMTMEVPEFAKHW